VQNPQDRPAVRVGHRGTVTQSVPTITWDSAGCAFELTLMGVEVKESDDPKGGYKFRLPMPVLYEIQIRKAGEKDWIFGFVLPFPGVEVSGLEPGVEYEILTTVLTPKKEPVGRSHSQLIRAD
jgi:hypothetical protein